MRFRERLLVKYKLYKAKQIEIFFTPWNICKQLLTVLLCDWGIEMFCNHLLELVIRDASLVLKSPSFNDFSHICIVFVNLSDLIKSYIDISARLLLLLATFLISLPSELFWVQQVGILPLMAFSGMIHHWLVHCKFLCRFPSITEMHIDIILSGEFHVWWFILGFCLVEVRCCHGLDKFGCSCSWFFRNFQVGCALVGD